MHNTTKNCIKQDFQFQSVQSCWNEKQPIIFVQTFSDANSKRLWPHCVGHGRNGILLPKLFWPTVRKNCSSGLEKNLQNFCDH